MAKYMGSSATQVLRDTHFRVSAPGSDTTVTERADWLAQGHLFLKACEEGTAEAPKDDKKLRRLAAFDWMLGVDWQLQCCVGVGLRAFVPQPEDKTPVHLRPLLNLNLDKGLQC